jgi:hypothetical protein
MKTTLTFTMLSDGMLNISSFPTVTHLTEAQKYELIGFLGIWLSIVCEFEAEGKDVDVDIDDLPIVYQADDEVREILCRCEHFPKEIPMFIALVARDLIE